jgi:outer membrane protein OmpA-like peptidoglycan-associated protein
MKKRRLVRCLVVALVAVCTGNAAGDDALVTSDQFIDTLSAPKPSLRTRSLVPIRTRGISTVAKKKAPEIAIRVLFKSGSAEVADDVSRRQLAEAGKAFSSSALGSLRFEIAGHTDSVGSDEYNMALSRARALALKEHLCQTFGIDPDRLTPRGYGETMPVAANDSPEGRAKNRRVVFKRLD